MTDQQATTMASLDAETLVRGREQRREKRFESHRRIEIAPWTAESPADWDFEPHELADCSPHGLGFWSAKPMTVGDEILVKVRLNKGTSVLVYAVRHCREVESGKFLIGAQLNGFINAPFDGSLESVLPALMDESPQ